MAVRCLPGRPGGVGSAGIAARSGVVRLKGSGSSRARGAPDVAADWEVRARVPGRGLVYRDERFPTGVVTPTVAEPPGRLRKEPARKGGRQTFDRRNTNGQ